MNVAPVSNLRRVLLLVIALVILVSLFVAVRWWPNALPTATPALTPALPPMATVANGPATYINSTKLSAANAVKLNLSAPWQVIDLNAEQLNGVLDKLQEKALAPSEQDAVKILLSAVDRNSTVLVALLLDEQATNNGQLPPNLTIVKAPRNNLSLSRYLEGIVADLRSRPGVTLHENKIDNTLRPDGIPVATVHYTIEGNLSPASMDGYQIAAYDQKADNLILFTFSTPAARYATLLPLFQEIVRTAQLN